MTISATALAEAPIAAPSSGETSNKAPPKRVTIAAAEPATVPQSR